MQITVGPNAAMLSKLKKKKEKEKGKHVVV